MHKSAVTYSELATRRNGETRQTNHFLRPFDLLLIELEVIDGAEVLPFEAQQTPIVFHHDSAIVTFATADDGSFAVELNGARQVGEQHHAAHLYAVCRSLRSRLGISGVLQMS